MTLGTETRGPRRRRLVVATIGALGLASGGVALLAEPAGAVPTAASSVEVACGNVYGAGGLVAAISAANASSHPTTINLVAGCTYSLTVAQHTLCCSIRDHDGLPVITADVTIQGHTTSASPGATIARSNVSSTPKFRILEVGPTGKLTLAGLNVVGGVNFAGGGIYDSMGGRLVMDNSKLIGNESLQGDGGGLLNAGSAFFHGSTVGGNSSVASQDDSGAFGGGIETFGSLRMTDSAVVGNRATALKTSIGNAEGGGIENTGSMTLIGTPVSGNFVESDTNGPFPLALADGGGIGNNQFGTPPAATLDHSPVDANTVSAPGGGMARGGGVAAVAGRIIVNNSAVTRNVVDPNAASTAAGGGIYLTAGSLTLNHARVFNNAPDNCAPAHAVNGCTG